MPAKRPKAVRKVKAARYDRKPMLEALRKAMAKLKKSELVDALVGMARDDEELLRVMEERFDVRLPGLADNQTNLKTMVQATREAIAAATDFDQRRVGHNFDYDSRAYETVQRNLEQLIRAQQFESAAELAVELMRKGSHQIEMSDEGNMTWDLENCLRPVVQGLLNSGLARDKIETLLQQIQTEDSCGFVCEKEFDAAASTIGCS